MRDIGLILKEGRIACGLEIDDVARRTCISMRYLKAMEEGRFNIIPTVFDKGYLKLYAKCLGMDSKRILDLYDQEKNRTLHPLAQQNA